VAKAKAGFNQENKRGYAMNALINRTKAFLVNDDGPTATEYAVMLALIIVVSIAAITLLGNRVNAMFGQVNTALGG
jgi:pilus assembly protein Flp/PilA